LNLFIDGQVFQTGALERGMGVLTIELLRALRKQRPDITVTILVNDQLKVSKRHQTKMDRMLDGFIIETVSLATTTSGTLELATRQLEAYITANGHKDDVYLIPALFLFDYYAIVPGNCKTILIFHDLIPLVMWDYLKNVFPAHVYFDRFSIINQVDGVLANSVNTKDELVSLLGVPEANVTVMGGAPEDFTPTKAEAAKRVRDLGVKGHYVLLPTGGGYMEHKNNARAVEALHLALLDTSNPFKIVATSSYEAHEKQSLHEYLGDAIIFTGNVDNEDMQALYMEAAVVLVPSLAEGLGIPLLNAVAAGVPVAASDIPVFTEIAGDLDPFYQFNPLDIWDMRDGIFAALARVDFDTKKQAYDRLLAEYTWDHCAARLLESLGRFSASPIGELRELQIVMPDPYADTRDGYRAQSLLAYTRQHGYRPRFFIDPGTVRPPYDDRGADYVRFAAHAEAIENYEPRQAATVPTLIFVAPNANFVDLHALSRLADGAVIYISDMVSDHLYPAMLDSGLLDIAMQESEAAIQAQLQHEGMYNVPHVLLKARAVIVEKRAEKPVRALLKQLGLKIPVEVVDNNNMTGLGAYVREGRIPADKILQTVSEAYSA
jgi:glycosyltransferase involved in cell wall biosynthesis